MCKIGTGFSDEVLKAAFELLKDKTTPNCPREYRVSQQMESVDVWFTPSVVWEVKGADFQVIYHSLSFPQFIPAELETPTPIKGLA